MVQDKERKDGHMMVPPEFRADQGSSGGGGLARNSSATVSISNSSPEEILSRYRPIAPKPLTLKPGESAGSAASDPPSSSTLSFERSSGGKAVTSDGSRAKRSRKRNGVEVPPTRRAKRGPAAKPRTIVSNIKGPAVIGGIQKAVEQFAPNGKSGFQPMPPIPTGAVFRSLKAGVAFTNPYVHELVSTENGPMFHGLEGIGTGHGVAGAIPFERKRSIGFGALKASGSDWSPKPGRLLPDASCAAPPAGTNVGVPVAEEPAFMDRAAAASAPPQPCFERETNGFQKFRPGYDGGFDNYSPKRGGTDGSTYRAPSIRPLDVTCPCSSPLTHINSSKAPPETQPRLTDQLSFVSRDGESEVISGSDNSRKTNLVTLSLLPDTPSHLSISSEECRPTNAKHHLPPFLSLAMGSDSINWEAETKSHEELHKLSLYSKGGHEQDVKLEERRSNGLDGDSSWGRRSSSAEKLSRALEGRALQEPLSRVFSCRDGGGVEDRAAVVDVTHMEKKYSTSCDPMILNDAQSGEPLWANQAYKKADAEKNGGKRKEAGAPYLDPLGVPTRLSSFDYQIPQGPVTKAILWGFLKKFMRPDTNGVSLLPRGDGDGDGQGDNRNQQAQERQFSLGLQEEFPENSQSSNHKKPITPHPIRPVGSTLTLDQVESSSHFVPPILDKLENVKEHLESSPMPSVITDKNRVRWVNAAYKQMVGQPECPWMASTVARTTTSNSRETTQHNRLMGEVMLNCGEQLSQLSGFFSCRVHVRWTNDGEENSVTVPADVTRISAEKQGVMYMWKLNIQSTNLILPKKDGVFR